MTEKYDSLIDVIDKIDSIISEDPDLQIDDRRYLKTIRGDVQGRLRDRYGEHTMRKFTSGEIEGGFCVCECHFDDDIEHDRSGFCVYCKCLDEHWFKVNER